MQKRTQAHTPESHAADTASMHRWLDRLGWATQKRLHGLRQGQHASLLRGQGLDLADLRPYQSGDDVRHIDWNASARLQQTHVRIFHEDRDLAAWFIVDASASSAFGSAGRSKRETALGYAGIVARLLVRQGNRVGAIVHTGQQAQVASSSAARPAWLGRLTGATPKTNATPPARMAVLPARSGSRQLWQLTQLLTQPGAAPIAHGKRGPAPGQITDLAAMLHEAGQLIRSRAAVFVLSDFVSQPGWDAALARLAQRHDVIAVHLVDPMEWQLPAAGPVALRDPETGAQLWVDTSDDRLHARFAALVAERDAGLAQGFARAGVDVLELSTTEDLPLAVVRQLLMRRPGAWSQAHRYPDMPEAA